MNSTKGPTKKIKIKVPPKVTDEISVSNKISNFINKNDMVEPLNWVLPNRKEFVNWINETFLKYRASGKTLPITNKFNPFKYQKLLRDYMQNNSPYRGVLLYHGLGTGKCHALNTPILMFNGSIKMVQDIIVGDKIMGDDSTERNILSLASGRDIMYKISFFDYSYIVNSEHILVLKDNNDNILEITVLDYLNLEEEIKNKLYGYRVKVEFSEKSTEIDPYLYGHTLKKSLIDVNYIVNSRDCRLKLLAGIIDADYGVYNNNYILKIYNDKNIDNIKYLCRSLGICVNPLIDYVSDEYILMKIYGNEIINIPIKNAKLTKVNQKDGNRYQIIVQRLQEDNYYGFTLDNNCRYLLEDFTVTHNTCSAITISENLKTERNIVVMLPASLRTNFIYDGLMFCGSSKYKNNPDLYKDKYSFISYNANNTIAQIKRIGSLDNKVIIIEEVHNLVSKMVSGIMGVSKQGLEIYNFLMEAQNAKIVALSGTPLINDPFETAVLFNILRGYIEITYFRIVKVGSMYGEEWDLGNLEEDLMKNKFIDYLEINKLNKSIEFHIKPRNYTEQYRNTLEDIESICNSNGVTVRFLELKKYSLFPVDGEGEVFRNYFVKEDLEKGDKMKNEEVFKRRILGLVSYYNAVNENYPTVIKKDYYRVEMSQYQFQIYEILRAKERLSERGGAGASSKKKTKNVKSTFRVFSRQASNFVFPEEINRPYPDPSFIVSILKNNKNKSDKFNTVKNINKLLALEESANENGKLSADYKFRINTAIAKLVDNGELYFTPGPEGLDKLSPKMKLMLENIQKSPGLIFVYSNFRTLEGIELFSKVLDFNGFSRYGKDDDKKKYAIYSGSEDEKEKKEILSIFTSTENKHGKFLKIILATSAGAEGLDLKNIRQIHIMEPYWNQMRIEQVIGRGVRRNSHIALPPNERNVEIFRYFSIFSKKNSILTKDKMTTDEHIEQLSLKKQLIISQLNLILKETAFDCLLNSPDIKGDYSCFNFGSDAKGFSYYPTISKDIIESHAVQNKKIVKKTLTQVVYFNTFVHLYDTKKKIFYLYNDEKRTPVEIDSKKAKVFYVNKDTNEVYDKKSANAGNPIKVGFIQDSKIKRKK